MKMKKWLKAILAGAMILGTACAASAEEDEIVLLKKNFSTGAVTECMSVKESQIPNHIVSEGFEGLFPNSDEKDGVQTLSIIGDGQSRNYHRFKSGTLQKYCQNYDHLVRWFQNSGNRLVIQ